MTNVRYPSTGEPEHVRFIVRGYRPAREEAASLAAIPYDRAPVSQEEVGMR